MWYLLLSVLSSTLVVLIFKGFSIFRIDAFQAIVYNYFVCVLCAWATLGRFPVHPGTVQEPWFPLALLLGFIFIVGFNIIAATVHHFNVTIAAVMQKMSLVLTVIYTIILYNESTGLYKILGILMAIGAIAMTNYREKAVEDATHSSRSWIVLALPFLTLFLSALIEIILFEVEQMNEVNADLGFIALLFGTAGLLGSIRLIFLLVRRHTTFRWKDLGAGMLLGVPNFFSIYFLLRVIGVGWEGSIVFPINNVGIIALSAILAWIIFREKLNRVNILGVICAIIAIVLIAISR
ncbi:MAG: EamA family transporter [Saprospiraceae bacterium]|nr:EamA family transporter [Saprospiraceae bacterium]